MEFFATNGHRPVRLSEPTRQFAWESINQKYGKQSFETPSVALDAVENYAEMSDLEKYNVAIECIVNEAPLRICEGERLSGAATLGSAIYHMVPATYKGERQFNSSCHLNIDFETVLKKGVNHIRQRAQESLARYAGTEKEPFVRSCLHCIGCMEVWHKRYLEALEAAGEDYRANLANLQRVPFQSARNFYEAVQSLWFTFAFVRLCGDWTGIGRIDWLLGDYLKQDLAAGNLALDEAREILAHFFIKGCEWVSGPDRVYGSGDGQHYQNIVLAGVDENGQDVTNEVTYLVLDILEELNISEFPTTVRINRNSSPALLRRVAEVIRLGGGVVAIYNEELIMESLEQYGYPRDEVWKFGNGGCWEVQIPGKTYFRYRSIDALHVLQTVTLKGYSEETSFSSYEALYRQFITDLRGPIAEIENESLRDFALDSDGPTTDWRWAPTVPCTVVSLFEQDCIGRGLSYLEGGPVYNLVSPHIGGLPDAANSLYAIKKLVFDDKKVSFSELMTILRSNWEEQEVLRQYALTKYAYFGNDNDEVDEIAAAIFEDFADMCDEMRGHTAYMTPAGVSTFGRQIVWAPGRIATSYGKKANTVLANNFSPTPGTDHEGATAIIKSYCKSNLRRAVNGAALDVKLLPAAVNCENGLEAIVALIRGFVKLDGYFMQLDVADAELLRAAQEHPEDYQTLSVRVSGWNARFVTLNREWQDMLIAQMGRGI